ncbi:hypothetical protein ABG768_009316, partial [Culter alburnus]
PPRNDIITRGRKSAARLRDVDTSLVRKMEAVGLVISQLPSHTKPGSESRLNGPPSIAAF